ncbi:DUF3995 domain-containing protein [Niallia sp. 01092]|uniref:DUF3995 domain-containing protein n=1 Tax=unclassified Niallia TaxID=2837522 RepID=UPI003FCFEF3A
MILKKQGTREIFDERSKRVVWAGYASFIWVTVFILFHIYWYYGGRFGLGDASDSIPPPPTTLSQWIYFYIVIIMFIAGTIVPLATIQFWGRFIPRKIILIACWLGCVILVLRGLAGMVDDLSRSLGLLPTGLTGLTYEQTTGDEHITTYTLWSSRAIDDISFWAGFYTV